MFSRDIKMSEQNNNKGKPVTIESIHAASMIEKQKSRSLNPNKRVIMERRQLNSRRRFNTK